MTKIILVDMDRALADFDKKVTDIYRAKFPDRPYVNLQDKDTFYLADQYPQ